MSDYFIWLCPLCAAQQLSSDSGPCRGTTAHPGCGKVMNPERVAVVIDAERCPECGGPAGGHAMRRCDDCAGVILVDEGYSDETRDPI